MDKNFNHLINLYHPIQWIFKSIERTRNRDLQDFIKKENGYSKPEFLIIMVDIALRISQNTNLNGKIPTHQEFNDFINLYIHTQLDKSKQLQDFGLITLPLMLYEQIKFIYSEKNMIGRMLVLYGKYEKDIKEFSGLGLNDILAILMYLKQFYSEKDTYFFSSSSIVVENIKALRRKNIDFFLNYFSITQKEYNLRLKKCGISKKQLYSFRLLERYPIIKFNNDKYIVPCMENLLNCVTSNLHIHLLEHFKKLEKSKSYHDKFGYEFENYIETLTRKIFSDVVPAKEIVPSSTIHSEFVIKHNDTSVAVEVKKFIFSRDTAFENDITDLDKLVKRSFIKAFAQIETTFQYINNQNKIGIIVIFGNLNLSPLIYDYLKMEYPTYKKENGEDINVEYSEKIIVMSVGDYESLLANTPDDIITILNFYLQKEISQRNDILQTINKLNMKTGNSFLYSKVDDSFRLLYAE